MQVTINLRTRLRKKQLLTIELVELPGVEPVGGEEHGEQQEDHGIGLESDIKRVNLSFPRGIAGDGDRSPICPNHLLRVDHGKRDESPQDGEDEERNLRTKLKLDCNFRRNLRT